MMNRKRAHERRIHRALLDAAGLGNDMDLAWAQSRSGEYRRDLDELDYGMAPLSGAMPRSGLDAVSSA